MRYRIREEKTYETDPEELKGRFPEEYADFLRHSNFTTDRDWVTECLNMGGVELFDLLDVEVYVD